MDCSLPGSSVHGILQIRILEYSSVLLLQRIFLTQGSNLGLPHCRQMLVPSEPPGQSNNQSTSQNLALLPGSLSWCHYSGQKTLSPPSSYFFHLFSYYSLSCFLYCNHVRILKCQVHFCLEAFTLAFPSPWNAIPPNVCAPNSVTSLKFCCIINLSVRFILTIVFIVCFTHASCSCLSFPVSPSASPPFNTSHN